MRKSKLRFPTKIFIAILFFLVLDFSYSQKPDSARVFTLADQMPEFTGGDKALSVFIGENFKYPKAAIERGQIGRTMTVSFVVNDSGKIRDIKIINGCDDAPSVGNELTRVLQKMPYWTPGKQNEKNVSLNIYISVAVLLNAADEKLGVKVVNLSTLKFNQKKGDDAYNAGVKKSETNNYQGAIDDFTEALKYNPKDIDALFNRAAMKLKLNDKTGACADWNLIKSLGKKDADELLLKHCGK